MARLGNNNKYDGHREPLYYKPGEGLGPIISLRYNLARPGLAMAMARLVQVCVDSDLDLIGLASHWQH
jgi:hypothetical protein